MDYNVVMKNNYPNVVYSGSGKSYDTVIWDVNLYGAKPTDATFISLYNTIQLRLLKDRQITAINISTQKAIIGGFISVCTGVPYRYDTAITDQVNASVRYSLGGSHSFKVTDVSTGNKLMVTHTNANLFQLIYDFSVFRDGLLAKYEVDKAAILAA